MASNEASDLGFLREVVKYRENSQPKPFQDVIDSSDRLLYRGISPFRNVVGNIQLLIAPETLH